MKQGKKGKRQRKSQRSKGLRRNCAKTSGFTGQFICTMNEDIKPGWSAKERQRIAEWQKFMYIEAKDYGNRPHKRVQS